MKLDWRAAVLPMLLLVLAEIGARSGGPSDSIAPPSAVAVALYTALGDGSLLLDTRDTLVSAFSGLAIGASIGLVLGVLFGGVRTLDRLMQAAIELLRPIPSVAVLPIVLVALGFGYRLEIAIVAYACIWPLLIFTRAAVAGVEPSLMEVSRALRLSLAARIFKIIVPAALPSIFVAFRLAAGVALVVAITVEIAVNPLGLGAGIMTAGQALRPELMLAYLVWISAIGFCLNTALVLVQQRLFGRAAQLAEAR